jgi:hypothetical protein
MWTPTMREGMSRAAPNRLVWRRNATSANQHDLLRTSSERRWNQVHPAGFVATAMLLIARALSIRMTAMWVGTSSRFLVRTTPPDKP